MMFWRLSLAALATLLLLAAPPAKADEASARAEAMVRGFVGDCVAARANTADLRKAEGTRAILRRSIDVGGVAETVLGRWWKKMAPAQQARFKSLFDGYLVATFDFGDLSNDIATLGLDRDGDLATIHTRIADPDGGTPTLFDWVVKDGPSPLIVDVMVDGQSLAKTTSGDFTAVLRGNGGDIDGFLDKLSDKVKALEGRG